MTRTTNRPSTSCSEALVRPRQRLESLRLAAFSLAPSRGGVFRVLLLSLAAVTAQAAPTPIEIDFSPRQVLLSLPDLPAPAAAGAGDPATMADQVQAYLEQARRDGDPRFLGYAQKRLANWPADRMTDRLLVLRATLRQSLHQFDQARADLDRVLAGDASRANRIQALLTLANLEIVQGNYGRAGDLCGRLQEVYPVLIAASCQAQVRARSGDANAAFQTLEAVMASSHADATARAWVLGTLAELAIQLDRRDAEKYLRRALQSAPGDLYLRGLYADWLLSQDDHEGTLAVTAGFDSVDSLAVLRAIALQRLDHPDAEALISNLAQRFAEARWRGTLLHQRDYARFLLDVRGDAEAAKVHAAANWQSQREPLDTRLLMRAAIAAGDNEVLAQTRAWLSQQQQRDARYPETKP